MITCTIRCMQCYGFGVPQKISISPPSRYKLTVKFEFKVSEHIQHYKPTIIIIPHLDNLVFVEYSMD